MAYFLQYLLQVTLWFLPLYFLYLALYKRFTFFSWNRYYLILIIFLSSIMPYVKYNYAIKANIKTETLLHINKEDVNNYSQLYSENNKLQTNEITNPTTINWTVILFYSYLFIAFAALVKLLSGLYSIRMLIKKSKRNWTNNLSLVYTNDQLPHSSFFHYIFLNNKTKKDCDVDKIILHEMQHGEKLHTIDVLFCELLKIVFWFNPFIYWYKKSLQEIHEFEVDNEMTKLYNEVAYAELLLQVATQNRNTLISTFSTTPLKTRLKMIFNPKTYPMKKLSFLLVVPLIAGLLMAYGNVTQKTVATNTFNTKPFTIAIDAGHGGKDAGAYGINGELEKDFTLNFSKQLQEKCLAAGYAVVMTRVDDNYPSLNERIEKVNAENVDLFISLHNNASENKSLNGIDCYIDNKNNEALDEASKNAATVIIKQLKNLNTINVHEFENKNHGIWIMKKSNCPSLLLELGYISNASDLKFINNKENQISIIENIVAGINNYKATKN
jgi:N-acetylmuramoyl-L-alanine amidase